MEGKPALRETHLPHTSLEALLKDKGQRETLRRFIVSLSVIMAGSWGAVTECVLRLSSSSDTKLAANFDELCDGERCI